MTTHTAQIPLKELLALNLLASSDETRMEINGVHIEASPERLLLVATDGRRLGVLESAGSTESTFKLTIPRVALKLAAELECPGEDCWITMEGNGSLQLRVLHDGCAVVLESKPIAVPYPDWRSTMPSESPKAALKIHLNSDYLSSWAAVGELLGLPEDGVLFLLHDEIGPVEVVFLREPRFRGLLMPMRAWNKPPARPTWFKPVETKPC